MLGAFLRLKPRRLSDTNDIFGTLNYLSRPPPSQETVESSTAAFRASAANVEKGSEGGRSQRIKTDGRCARGRRGAKKDAEMNNSILIAALQERLPSSFMSRHPETGKVFEDAQSWQRELTFVMIW